MTEELAKKLDVLIKLSAAQVILNKPLHEQVRILSSAGLTPKEISEIIGKSSNQIRVTIFHLKKRRLEANK